MWKFKYIIGSILLICFMQSCYLFKAIKYKDFALKDINKFETDTLKASSHPFQFYPAGESPFKTYLDTNLAQSQTYSFLVIRNDSILYENYWEGLNQQSLLPAFSVAKSFVSTLIGMALKDGFIKSLQEPITQYIPELLKRDKRFGKITIQQVMDMRSGIKSSEDYYNPNSDVLKMGFGSNLWSLIKRIKIEKDPGSFEYKSVNTQILSIILERATGKKTQDYMQEKIWEPLGMEANATWNIDSKKHNMVRAFCCINAITRDYAKLGRLFLNDGVWDGVNLLPDQWVTQSTHVDTMINNEGYKNQWWSNAYSYAFKDSLKAVDFINTTPNSEQAIYIRNIKADPKKNKPASKWYIVYVLKEVYHAEGLLGQYIYVNPKKNLIIVRTGHYWSHNKFGAADHFIYDVGEKYF